MLEAGSSVGFDDVSRGGDWKGAQLHLQSQNNDVSLYLNDIDQPRRSQGC